MNSNEISWNIEDNESNIDYINRIVDYKRNKYTSKSWVDIAELINTNTGLTYNESTYRKWKIKDYSKVNVVNPNQLITDVSNSINSLKRKISREETLKQIAFDVSQNISRQFLLAPVNNKLVDKQENAACLLLSDWHYGMKIDNSLNTYNCEIAKQRVQRLQDNVITYLNLHKDITELYILNLGDLVSGRIHTTIRIDNQIDAVTQVIEISEILAEFIANIANYTDVHIKYYDTLDNHSRLEPNKENSVELESLQRITHWHLQHRLSKFINIDILDNNFSDDIITTTILGHPVAAVHGDKDKQATIVANLSMITRNIYDLVCAAHLHHFSADEQNQCIVISNGCLMGTDNYSQKLRLSSIPSQTLVVITKNNSCKEIIRFELN